MLLNLKCKMKRYVMIICCVSLFIVCQSMAQQASQDTLPDDYLPFTLHKVEDRFEGKSEYLQGFSLSLNIDPDSLGKGGDERTLLAIVRDQNITGTLTYPNGRQTEVQYETVFHRKTEEIYMKTTLGYFLWERLRVSADSIGFAIYWWYCPPARQVDVEALEMAEQLLADSTHWHKNDDRKCEDDAEQNRWSLFCALKHASIEKMGEYNHHNTAMQTVRFVIHDLSPDYEFEHTLMDYNNSPQTTYDDILNVLRLAKVRIQKELKVKE